MTVRLVLVSHALTAAQVAGAFPDDEPLDGRDLRRAGLGSTAGSGSGAAALDPESGSVSAGSGSAAGRAIPIRGPERRCEQTAAALGLRADPAADLRDCDFGRWRGRTLADVEADEADGVRRWLSDPAAAPHGGEPVLDVIGRVARWLAGLPDGKVIAVTHPSVIRAAAVHALQVDPATFWRFDVEPLARVALTGRSGRWNLRFGPET